jgi:hypothetical protein
MGIAICVRGICILYMCNLDDMAHDAHFSGISLKKFLIGAGWHAMCLYPEQFFGQVHHGISH